MEISPDTQKRAEEIDYEYKKFRDRKFNLFLNDSNLQSDPHFQALQDFLFFKLAQLEEARFANDKKAEK